jgi:hypothetical protein
MKSPSKEEMLKELAFSWGHGGIGNKPEAYQSIRDLIEKYGDEKKVTNADVFDTWNLIQNGWMSNEGFIEWLRSKGITVEGE